MKKTNLIAALAIIALSATQVMAHQFDNYEIDKELSRGIQASVQEGFNDQYQNQKTSPSIVYQNALDALFQLRDDKDLINQDQDIVRQKIFDTINNLAEAILNLPEQDYDRMANSIDEALSERPFQYFHRAVQLHRPFKYVNDNVTLHELFDFAVEFRIIQNSLYSREYKPSIPYDDNTPIVQLLTKQKKRNADINDLVLNSRNLNNTFIEMLQKNLKEKEEDSDKEEYANMLKTYKEILVTLNEKYTHNNKAKIYRLLSKLYSELLYDYGNNAHEREEYFNFLCKQDRYFLKSENSIVNMAFLTQDAKNYYHLGELKYNSGTPLKERLQPNFWEKLSNWSHTPVGEAFKNSIPEWSTK